MTHKVTVEGRMIRATTSDILKLDERMEILRKIAEAWDQCDADVILIDHFAAQLDCHITDARKFGGAIKGLLEDRPPCFVAIFVSELNIGNLNLVRTSISHVSELQKHSRIKCYTKEQLISRDIEAWRLNGGGKS